MSVELAQSLILNEEALADVPDQRKPVFIYEWLRFLDRVLGAAQKADIKASQSRLVEQLTAQLNSSTTGPASRQLLGKCFATLFSVGDTFTLFATINGCNDILKAKEDAASGSNLATRLSAVTCIGHLYEKLGRMVGRSYEETCQILLRCLKNSESQMRCEIMNTFSKIVHGLGTAGQGVHKDIYKAAKNSLTDRSMSVRCSSARCLESLVREAQFLWTTELEIVTSCCFKAFEASSYEVRLAVSSLLAETLATAHDPKRILPPSMLSAQQHVAALMSKSIPLDDCLNHLATGFLRGGTGFLKGSTASGPSNIPREMRIGVALTYTEFVRKLGPSWLERNLPPLLRHILELCANIKPPSAPGAATDFAIHVRRAVGAILRQICGHLLDEKAQYVAVRVLGLVITEHISNIEVAPDQSLDRNTVGSDVIANQHIMITALNELASLVQQLSTMVSPLFTDAAGIMEPVFSVLLHPCEPVRIAGAWTLRCVATAVPSLLTPLIDRCLNRLEHLRSSGDAISGYSLAIVALLGGAHQCPLGVPQAKGKQVSSTAEEMLRTASQTSRLTAAKTTAGWDMLAAVMCLGSSVVKPQLSKYLMLWKNAFPRSAKEADAERQRGDGFTWQITLQARAGALGAIHNFLAHCADLVTDDVTRRLLLPIDVALTSLSHMPDVIRSNGTHLRPLAALMRMRLYATLGQMQSTRYESCFAPLLRELVAEFTLTEQPSAVATSLLHSVCHQDDRVVLGAYVRDTDQARLEEQLEPFRKSEASGASAIPTIHLGALEYDSFALCERRNAESNSIEPPSPLYWSIAAIDSSVRLFGTMLPLVPAKHRLQMLEHFADCIKQARAPRQHAIQINIFTALLCSLKCLAEQKGTFETENVRKAAVNLIVTSLDSPNGILRVAAAEAMGRVAQVVADPRFVAELAQFCFDKLKSSRDIPSRTSYSLALGCLHRYVGGLGSGHHLNTSISVLLALSQDHSMPAVQVWALHALCLIGDSGGPMFRGYVEPSLALSLRLLLVTPPSHVDVLQCIGKLISALITTVGPELQNNIGAIVATRSNLLCACALMTDQADPLVQAEALACLQQLHMFAPRHVNLASLVPQLCSILSSRHLVLRRAAVACMRQLVQREAKEVHNHASALAVEQQSKNAMTHSQPQPALLPDTGLEGALFSLLDRSTDPALRANVQETLHSLAQCLAADDLTHWLTLCKDILASSADSGGDEKVVKSSVGLDDEEGDGGAEGTSFGVGGGDRAELDRLEPRWSTRVVAIETVTRVIALCETERAHFDLALAKELQTTSSKDDYLVLHLSDLVRMSFMAATSDIVPLRLSGLAALENIVHKFAHVAEPEFPGHVILEQFQAQVGAALRPAFAADTPPHVTAAACEVCSTWIGSGVARDLNDLRRVHQLLVSSLSHLKAGSISTQLYNESASTLEKLAILKAWAEVYIVAVEKDEARREAQTKRDALLAKRREEEDDAALEQLEAVSSAGNLLELVTPELDALLDHWLALLHDYGLLSLPSELHSQLPSNGGAFYTSDCLDAVRPHYRRAWPPVLLAAATRLRDADFRLPKEAADAVAKRFFLLQGLCMEALCSPRSLEHTATVTRCLRAMTVLLDCTPVRRLLTADTQLLVEMLNVVHRLILTRANVAVQLCCLRLLDKVLSTAETAAADKEDGVDDGEDSVSLPPLPATNGDTPRLHHPYTGKEAPMEDGHFDTSNSVVLAALEVCLCCLAKQLPGISPVRTTQTQRRHALLSSDAHVLIGGALAALARLPKLCDAHGAVTLLPSAAFLCVGVIRETSRLDPSQIVPDREPGHVSVPTAAALQTLKTLVVGTAPPQNDAALQSAYLQTLHSVLLSLLQYANAKEEESTDTPAIVVDPVALLLSTAVFHISAPRHVTCSESVKSACVAFYSRCLDASQNMSVRRKALQTLQSIFAVKDTLVASTYLRALGPTVLSLLRDYGNVERLSQLDAGEVPLLMDAAAVLHTMVLNATPDSRQSFVTLAAQLLLPFVDVDASSSESARQLRTQTVASLTRLNQACPVEFKALIDSHPSIAETLRTALAHPSLGRRDSQLKAQKAQLAQETADREAAAQPQIKLTMDFSKFCKTTST